MTLFKTAFKDAVVRLSIQRYRLVILAILALTLAAGAFLPRVVMDTDPENMLESDEPARIFHNAAKETFSLSDTVVVGILNEDDPDGVFNPESLERVYELTEFAKTLRWEDEESPGGYSGVIEAEMIAPSLVDHMSRGEAGSIRFEWLMERPPETREAAKALKEKALSNPLLTGRMVSEDGRALCLYLPLTDKLLSYRVYTELQKKIETFDGEESYHIMGLPVAESAIGVEMFTQMTVACPLAMAVIFGLLFLFFRKFSMIVLPMIIATVSIVITMGLMIACGFPVHILSSMLPIFLMSISMVDSVHVLSEFFDVYTEEKGRRQSIREVMAALFSPMLFTSLTTAIGFLSLVLAPIPPARVFGAFLSVGVMVAWGVTILFVPAYIMVLPRRVLKRFGLAGRKSGRRDLLTRMLSAMGRLAVGRSRAIIILLAAGVLISAWGITRIRINDNYAKRFSVGHPIRTADEALNRHFGGTYMAFLVLEEVAGGGGAFENRSILEDFSSFCLEMEAEYPLAPELGENLAPELSRIAEEKEDAGTFLEAAETFVLAAAQGASDEEIDLLYEMANVFALAREERKTFKRPEVLSYMAGLQSHLEEIGLVGKSTSVADVVCKVHQELTDGRGANYRIPERFQTISECYLQYQQSHRPGDLWHLVTPDYMQANIQFQFPTGDSANTKAAVAAVESYFEQNPPPAALGYQWAGLHYINRVLETRLVWGFLKSFMGSFLVVFVLMAFLFRSAVWGLLCMMPLGVTLLGIYGATGLFGKDYDLPIAVLSALSIGMAVDFAIHFLERSRAAFRKTGSWEKTAPRMFGEPARAISRNVLVIAVGFLPLLTASLVPYKTTGLLLFAILLCSGVVSLLGLPAILTVGEKTFFKSLTVQDKGEEK